MIVAKSNRRKRQDRVKADARRAEQARRHAKAEREQQTAERYRRLLDPRTSPADVAGILAAELPDSLAAGAMMQIRLSSGVPGEEIAQTARLMLASATGTPQIGTLAVPRGRRISPETRTPSAGMTASCSPGRMPSTTWNCDLR